MERVEKFLKEAEVLFDGNTYKLNIEEKNLNFLVEIGMVFFDDQVHELQPGGQE